MLNNSREHHAQQRASSSTTKYFSLANVAEVCSLSSQSDYVARRVSIALVAETLWISSTTSTTFRTALSSRYLSMVKTHLSTADFGFRVSFRADASRLSVRGRMVASQLVVVAIRVPPAHHPMRCLRLPPAHLPMGCLRVPPAHRAASVVQRQRQPRQQCHCHRNRRSRYFT